MTENKQSCQLKISVSCLQSSNNSLSKASLNVQESWHPDLVEPDLVEAF